MGITNKNIKLVQSLSKIKNRRETGLFVVEGEKMLQELLKSNLEIEAIYSTKNWNALLSNEIENRRHIVNENELKKISSLSTPNNVLALVKQPDYKNPLHDVFDNELVLILDRIQDPGNLGTIIRMADWFNIEEIICSLDSVDVYNAKVVQATMGSMFRVNVSYTDLIPAIKNLKAKMNLKIFGATMEGHNIYEMPIKLPSALILGNESQGISNEVLELLDEEVTIPLYKTGNIPESLNVGMAASILCSEIMRQNFYSK